MKAPIYINRELSWLDFNERVLGEALDPATPPMERLKFLAIVSSNLDEFFMVRVAAVKSECRKNPNFKDPAGMTPSQQAASISAKVRALLERQYKCFDEVRGQLAEHGFKIVEPSGWTTAEKHWLEAHFASEIFPLLTPQRLENTDDRGAFPSMVNLKTYVAFRIVSDRVTDGSEEKYAMIQVPDNMERMVRMASGDKGIRIALLEDIIGAFGGRLFVGWSVKETLAFRVTRDADFAVDESRDEDFIMAMEEILAERQVSYPVCLSVSKSTGGTLDAALCSALKMHQEDVYRVPWPIELRSFMAVTIPGTVQVQHSDDLWYQPWNPVPGHSSPEGFTMFDEILARDALVHVPYESFDPVIRFLEEAAEDAAVLAIKITLYRTSGNSPIVRALTKAASKGKQVTVLVELKARFDEERNIEWAGNLERAGAIVVYGIARLKVHAKIALVIRRTPHSAMQRFLHLSTGNYNEKTAKLYVDLSIFTADEAMCREASIFFNIITGYSTLQKMQHLAVAPFDLKSRLIALINREAKRSTPEAPGLIMAKLNALADVDVIDALYKASQAGVRILLNIRGVCCLIPGKTGLSENIRVVSILGRYLEHTRIIHFENGGNRETYLSSADWLPRNLERRIELMFPVRDNKIRQRITDILETYFADNAKAHELQSDRSWKKLAPGPGSIPLSAQEVFYEAARKHQSLLDAPQEDLQVRRKPREEV